MRFTFDPTTQALTAEWRRPPANQAELDAVLKDYRAARDKFLAELVPGQKVLVIE